MKIINIEQRSPEWFEYKKGKISGTHLGDLYSVRGGHKIGFYEVIAERLGLEPDDENRMDRGIRLEDEAIMLFEEKYNKQVEKAGICVSDEYPDIINSPDGLIKQGSIYPEAVEVKCLSPARHLQAVIENTVPKEFIAQTVQYFIVNEELEKLFVIFYDPRIVSTPFHVITVSRHMLQKDIIKFYEYEKLALQEIDEIVERLAF